MKEIEKGPEWGSFFCWLVAPFSSEHWDLYSFALSGSQTVRTGIFSVDILYFPQWNVSDGG